MFFSCSLSRNEVDVRMEKLEKSLFFGAFIYCSINDVSCLVEIHTLVA